MSLIKCPECGHDVSDRAPQCPYCGVEIKHNTITCPDCGKVLLKSESVCSNCGCQLLAGKSETGHKRKSAAGYNRYPDMKEEKRSGGHTLLWVMVTTIVVLGVAAGGYYFYDRMQQEQAMQQAYAALDGSQEPSEYEAFLNKYPESAFRQEVKKKMERLLLVKKQWDELGATSTKESFMQFMKNFPESRYVADCQNKIDSIDWTEVNAENTPEAYQRYLKEHPEGRYVAEAKVGKEKLALFTTTFGERHTVRQRVIAYLNAISDNQPEAVDTMAVEAVTSQLREMCETLHGQNSKVRMLSVSPIFVTKAPGEHDSYIYLAKMSVQRLLTSPQGYVRSNYFATVVKLSPSLQLLDVKMTEEARPVQPRSSEE